MVATACPTADELKNYTLGRLSEPDWTAIAEHLESCRQCQAAIATVDDVADTLVTQLREPAPGDSFLNESQCEAALIRARDIKGGAGILPVQPENNTGSKLPVAPDEINTGKLPVPPGVEFEGYQILEELGQGGMGAVYKALHTKLDRVVAIKILSRGRAGDERAIARFEREMKAVGRFDHPHIVRAYDARAGGTGVPPVLIMEFVEGMDLGRLVRRLGPLPMADACELVRQACLGLQYIHEQGLVHRDLKPSNLMLTRQGTVKILDLGLARFHFEQSEEEMTHSGQAMGTADYMAPEQASDSHAVDIRADIYSLGCTLYKLLAGFAPFEGSQYKGTFEKMTAHVQQSAPPIENLLPEIPGKLAAILEKMLAKNPADRFNQPADVIEALTPFCANAALSALLVQAEEAKTLQSCEFAARIPKRSGSSAARPASQPIRRRPSILAATGLLLFTLGFGLGYSFGILVTIKKDGKTTAIDVPEGSNVHVDGQGNVGVDLNTNKSADTVGPESFKILPGDVLHITVEEGSMIDGDFGVDSSGMLDLSTAKIEGVYGGKEWVVKHFKNLEPISAHGLDLAHATKKIREQLGRILDFLPKTVLTFDRKTLERRMKSIRQEPSQSRSIAEKQEINVRNLRESRNELPTRAEPESHNIDLSTSDGKAAVPPEPYTILPGDSLVIRAVGTITDDPIDGIYVVEPAGTVALGPAYGRVIVKGLSLVEAEGAIAKQLKQILRQPEVSVTLAGWVDRSKPQAPPVEHRIAPGDILDIWACGTIPDQPIHGPYLVEPDGQVTLGPAYGRVNLNGQTFEEAEKTVTKQLMQILRQPEISITLGGWRKERKSKEDEAIQKANASKTTRAVNIPSVRGVKTSDVNITLTPPLLQPTQGSLTSSFPTKALVPVLPGLTSEGQGSGLSTDEGKKDDGQKAIETKPATEVAVAVLDVCDSNSAHGNGIRLIAADGKEIYMRRGLENNQNSGANHGVVIDPQRRHVFFRESVANRVTGVDFAGKTLFQSEIKAGSLAVDPKTGNLWCLSGGDKTVVLDGDGRSIQTYTLGGFDIAYDSHDDAFWIVGKNVMKVDRQGEILFQTAKAGWMYVSVAPNKQDGSAWVVERSHPDVPGSANRLLLFDDKGRELKKLDKVDSDPFGVACDSETGAAWVVILRKGISRVPVKGEPLPLLDIPAVSIAIGPDSGQFWIGTQTEVVRLDKEGKVIVRYPLGCESGQNWLIAR